MKKYQGHFLPDFKPSFLIIFLFILLENGFAQSCLPNGITITTQQEIDSFPINYPGCTHVIGNVEIYGDMISNLDGLNGITDIDGTFLINAPSLTSITGMDLLTHIGVDPDHYITNAGLVILNCTNLTSVSGFNNLTSIDGNLLIKTNNSLLNITGFSLLNSVGSVFDIRENNSLSSIPSFSSLGITGGLAIELNNNLSSLSGFSNLSNVDGNFSIYSNEILPAITGFDILSNVKGSFYISRNALVSIPQFNALNSVGGEFSIFFEHLSSINGFDSLITIGSNFAIGYTTNTTQIKGFKSLDFVGGYIDISDNSELNNIGGFDSLNYIGVWLQISDNPLLTNITAFLKLNVVGEDGFGGIVFQNNPQLTNLSSFTSLTDINGQFAIVDNNNLLSLSGLDNIDYNSISQVYIHGNNSLQVCAITSICNYLNLANPAYADIAQNGIGCNSVNEVFTACPVSTSDLDHVDKIILFPNPTHGELEIEGLDLFGELYSISNTLGKVCKKGTFSANQNINIKNFPKGIYFLTIYLENATITKIIVKQ